MNVRYDHVTVFVVRPAGADFEFLQLRRRADDYLGGTWQTVRGTSQHGETSLQTALRELFEETALEPTEMYSVGMVESYYIAAADTLFHSPVFVAMVSAGAGVTLDREHDAFRWIAEREAGELFIWASEAPLLREVSEKILRDGLAKPHLRLEV